MKNKIITSESRKQQKEALTEALNAEKSQGSALRRLKTLADQYKEVFQLSDFQTAILSKQKDYFRILKYAYTDSQKKKVKQIGLIKEGKEPLINKSYSVIQVIEETKTLPEMTDTLRTFGKKEKATEYIKDHRLNGRTGIAFRIETNESIVSTNFTPNEMLGLLQRVEKKFFDTFPNAESVTVPNLERALTDKVSDKARKNDVAKVKLSDSKEGKKTDKKAA